MAKNERLIPKNCSDALLVKGYLLLTFNTDQIPIKELVSLTLFKLSISNSLSSPYSNNNEIPLLTFFEVNILSNSSFFL